MGKFDLGTLISSRTVPLEQNRTIETVTGEILELKKTAGDAILGIGRRLVEAKSILPHGEWLPWLTGQVEFSERTAQNFMRLSREWSNPQTLADLGASKALTLLALPPEEREQFMSESHMVDGQEKGVIDMSARELEKAIRERDEARKAMEQAKADARHAEESRVKMESDVALLKKQYEAVQAEATALKNSEGQVVRAAEDKAALLAKELEELRSAPVDVAVMAVDQAALDQARAEAVAEIQAKLERIKEAKEKADDKRKAAEEALAAANAKLEEVEKTAKQAALAGDKEVAAFDLLLSQAQEHVNKLYGLLLKVRGRGDEALACKLQLALLALSENIRGCAE